MCDIPTAIARSEVKKPIHETTRSRNQFSAGFLQKSPAQEIWRTVGLRRVAAFEFSPAF
jgi:hypothetical protein